MADNIKYRFIQNVGDYFPSGYFSEDFIDKVQKTAGLSKEEMDALCPPFVALRREYGLYKNYIVNTNPRVKDAIKQTHEFNDKLLKILGYPVTDAYTFYSVTDDATSVVPVRQVLHRNNETSMLVMEMQHLIKVGDNEPGGLFEQQYNVDGNTETVRHQQYYAGQWSAVFNVPEDTHISPTVINKAIDALFFLPKERRPHYILMMAGNTIFLLDAEKWSRGAYLQFSLDELFSQANIPTFRKYYALFHLLTCKETLAANSESALMDKLVEESYKNAYEVTKDMKVGVVDSVETLANEALYWWQQNDCVPVDDYTDDTFESKVKDDCLTIIYRLLFIFYAESRDELDILPTHDDVYDEGYSLEMLRDLEKVPLISETTRNGFFIHESLNHLFGLLSSGYKDSGNKSFSVRKIDSPLFDNDRLHYFKDVKFRNVAWQKIIRSLSLSNSTRQVGRISYANLGINQLGSVYESLLAYRGFYAEEDYIEVHKAGHPEEGTFLVPYSRMDDFETDEILSDDQEKPVILKKGTFVYRLNGRDRQKSASYYTPEVLTRSTVKYTLKAILDDIREGKKSALELLDLKILEPAMGAAAFQNEVVNQLAEAYLQYRQEEKRNEGVSTWRIAPDHYRDELQKVKAYIATHNVYGVDLNPTAIELGKLSLWLNVIHKDMETPFFSNRLALGNAVIGAWLKCYSKEEVIGKTQRSGRKLLPTKWWENAPHKISFNKNSVHRSVNEIYHFLLPDENMLAVRIIKDYKDQARKENSDTENHDKPTFRALQGMKSGIADWTAAISDVEFRKLQKLSSKIDMLLKEYFQFQQNVESLTQNKVNLWGVSGSPVIEFDTYAEKERLNDVRYRHDNAYFRLKMVMDYWCALWFWPLEKAEDLPTREDYWRDIDAMLGVSDEQLDANTARSLRQCISVDSAGQLGIFPQYHQYDMFKEAQLDMMVHEPTQEENTLSDEQESEIKRMSKEEILTQVHGERMTFFDESLRFQVVKELSDRYHFFHPMLEFLEVFWLRDGFDIICGNPPWLKYEFDEVSIISEKFPEVAIRNVSAPDVRKTRENFFENKLMEEIYYNEYIDYTGSVVFMNAYSNYPLLKGQQTNLYKCVLENGFSMMSDEGFMGLLHPETVYDDPKGQPLRKELYHRLRFHFQYQNAFNLFAEIAHREKYGSHIYGGKRDEISFYSINNLFHPSTIDACFCHDGHGVCGGIKTNEQWNVEGHRDRIVHFGEQELRVLAKTFEDSEEWETTKLVSIHAKEIIDVLKSLSSFPSHVSDYDNKVSEGLHETNAVDDGTMHRNTKYPSIDNYEMIYSGPHFYVSNPCYKTPKEKCIQKADYDTIDLLSLPEDFIARTNYTPLLSLNKYKSLINGFVIGQVNGQPAYDNWIEHYKLGFRKMLSQAGERTLTGAILPKNCSHIHGVISITFQDIFNIVECTGLTSSIVLDFFVKTLGSANLTDGRIVSFPLGINTKYKSALFSRTLLLNCLNKYYSALWSSCWDVAYAKESWSINDSRLKQFNDLTSSWSWTIPLRNYFERRQALVEIDVISAMALGLKLDDLIMMYEIQFPVLQQNEADTWYDSKGKIVFTCSKGLTGVGLDRPVWEAMRGEQKDKLTYLGTTPTYEHTIEKSELYRAQKQTFVAPYTCCDRIADYRRAWAFFEKRFK